MSHLVEHQSLSVSGLRLECHFAMVFDQSCDHGCAPARQRPRKLRTRRATRGWPRPRATKGGSNAVSKIGLIPTADDKLWAVAWDPFAFASSKGTLSVQLVCPPQQDQRHHRIGARPGFSGCPDHDDALSDFGHLYGLIH